VLAGHLGATVAELKARMSRVEFRRWWHFHQHNPIDPVGLHLRGQALIAHYIAAHSMGGSKQDFAEVLGHLAKPDPDAEAWSVFDAFLS
jgi:hypothetical protein